MTRVVLLPRLLVLTDRRQAEARGRTLPETVEAAVEGGARAVVLREKDLPPEERRELAEKLLATLAAAGGALIVASDRELAIGLGAAGVHLAAGDPWRPGRDLGLLVGRSCHGAEELLRAGQTGADYVTLSPVYASRSKPGYGPPLGTDGLSQLLGGNTVLVRVPRVFALGGVTEDRVEESLAAGAYGVAVMGAVMRADEPRAVVEGLLGMLPQPEVTR